MSLILKTAPASEPVTTALVSSYCRVTDSDENTEIAAIALAARERVEADSGLCLISQTWLDYRACFPFVDFIRLPKAPLISVDSIKYYDEDNTLQTLSASYYVASPAGSIPAIVELAYGYDWPTTYDRQDAVVIEFKVGYASADVVPAAAKIAIKALARHLYDNRGLVQSGTTITSIPAGYENLVASFGVKNV